MFKENKHAPVGGGEEAVPEQVDFYKAEEALQEQSLDSLGVCLVPIENKQPLKPLNSPPWTQVQSLSIVFIIFYLSAAVTLTVSR